MGGRGGGGGGKGSHGGWGGGSGSGGGKGTAGGGGASWTDGMGQMLQMLQQQNHQQQQLLQAMCTGDFAPHAGGERAGGGQRRGGKGGGKNSGARQSREGDWKCSRCQFTPNFASRTRCFGCGEPRGGPAAARGGSLTSGPVGAGGLRPQLAWGSARLGPPPGEPTRRVPGASVAAAAQSAAAAASSAASATAAAQRSAGGGVTRTAAASPANVWTSGAGTRRDAGQRGGGKRIDSDGFEEVVSRSSRRRMDKAAGSSGGDVDMDLSEADGHRDGGAGEDATRDGGAWDGDWEEDEEEGDDAPQPEETDPAALKRRLDREEATLRTLQREGVEDDHPTVLAATAARDAAADAWQAARKPHPIARRMGWVQRSLDRAYRSQEKVRAEMAHFDEQVKIQRDKIIERMEQARARVHKHRAALEDLQVEAGAEVYTAKKIARDSSVCAKLAGGMRDKVAPSVAALAAALTEGSEAHGHLNLLMAQLEGVQSELERHACDDDADHEAYDIGDDEYHSDDAWSESHDLAWGAGNSNATRAAARGPQELPRWQSEGHSRWNRGGKGDGGGRTEAAATAAAPAVSAGTARATQHSPEGIATATPPRAPTGTEGATATPPAATSPTGKGSALRSDQGDGAESASKHRRGQAAEDTADAYAAAQDTARALELMQHQQHAAAAGSFGSEAAAQAAAQIHARKVAQVVTAAIAQGVQPLTADGEELIMLGPQDLSAWAAEHLKHAAW